VNNTILNFVETAKDKKLIIMGNGIEIDRAIEQFIIPNGLKAEYIISGIPTSDTVKGIPVYSITKLYDEAGSGICVLITGQYPFIISEILKQIGIENYFSSELFIENKIGKRQFMIFLKTDIFGADWRELLKRDSITLFGCGADGQRIFSDISWCFLPVKYFCDNNPELWGTKVCGVPVISPGELKDNGSDVIITSSKFFTEIDSQLKELGIKAINGCD
jgi:hypothetical protein